MLFSTIVFNKLNYNTLIKTNIKNKKKQIKYEDRLPSQNVTILNIKFYNIAVDY